MFIFYVTFQITVNESKSLSREGHGSQGPHRAIPAINDFKKYRENLFFTLQFLFVSIYSGIFNIFLFSFAFHGKYLNIIVIQIVCWLYSNSRLKMEVEEFKELCRKLKVSYFSFEFSSNKISFFYWKNVFLLKGSTDSNVWYSEIFNSL